MKQSGRMVFIGVLIILLNACTSLKVDDWNAAKEKNTELSYSNYIKKHRNSEFTPLAKNRLDALQVKNDELMWKQVNIKNTLSGYRKYLDNSFTQKKHRILAKKKIKALKEEELYKKILDKNAANSVDVNKYFRDYLNGNYASDIFNKLSKKNNYYQAGNYRLKFQPSVIKLSKSIKTIVHQNYVRIINGEVQAKYSTKVPKRGYSFVIIRSDIYNDMKEKEIKKSDIYLTDGRNKYPIKSIMDQWAILGVQELSLGPISKKIKLPRRTEMQFTFEARTKSLNKLYFVYKEKRIMPVKKVMESLRSNNGGGHRG